MTLVELEALDDGPPRPTSFVEVPLDEARELPTLPESARAFVARGRARDGRLSAWGVLPVRDGKASGPLFPLGAACRLLDPAHAPALFPPLAAPSQGSLGQTTVLAGGRDAEGEARADLLLVESGRVTRLGMRRRRASPTVVLGETAEAGRQVLVAGGEAASGIWEDAELVVDGSLSPDPVLLAEPRAEAAGLLLPSGEALLVGGRGPRGALRTFEAVDLRRRSTRSIDLASLARPRIAPIALRFASGEVAILGGHDETSAPVGDVEVYDANGVRRLGVLSLPPSLHVDAVALASGALLVVTHDTAGVGAMLVRPDGIERLPDPPLPRTGVAPRLIPASDGAPFLVADVAARYEPFSGAFSTVSLPSTFDATTTFPIGPGVLGWLGAVQGAATVRAVRYDVRTEWVTDAEPLGLGSTAHLVPDRLGVLVGREGLVIPAGGRVAVADATYGAFSLRLGAVGRALPEIELRDAFGALVGSVSDAGVCAWPVVATEGVEQTTSLVREGSGLILRAGSLERRCALSSTTRVTLTLVARTREARVRGITVTRGA